MIGGPAADFPGLFPVLKLREDPRIQQRAPADGDPRTAGEDQHAVRIGDLLFCAGQIPLDPATGNLVAGDIKAQTERVLENVKTILEDQGLKFSNVVKSTVFLTNLADFAGMNEEWVKWFAKDPPARQGAKLPVRPKSIKVSIAVIAEN